MDSFGAGDLEVDVDVQPGRDLGDILAVVVVVGDRRPPVAVDGEARQQRIQLTEEGAALVVFAGGVLLATQLERRARRLDGGLRAVDVDVASWHRSPCRTADRAGKGLPCSACLFAFACRWVSGVVRAVFSSWSCADVLRRRHWLPSGGIVPVQAAGPHLRSTSLPCWPRCCLGLPRFCGRAGHHEVATGYQRDSGGRCPGAVPKVAFCVASHVYAPRRGSDLRMALGSARIRTLGSSASSGFTSNSTVEALKLNIRSFMRRSISLVAPTKRMK